MFEGYLPCACCVDDGGADDRGTDDAGYFDYDGCTGDVDGCESVYLALGTV